ncbi:hypothetical protein F2P79_005788 [Pimephales promelas]|nr:hypothetical protein F2P79_005788 [Pimephales promelas]
MHMPLIPCFAEGIMKFGSTATEEYIKLNVSEHLKHTSQRLGASSVCLIVNNRLTEKCQFKILQKWTPTSWIPLSLHFCTQV